MTASGLLIKLQNDAQAVILLAERGLPEQAMSMLRVAFESLIRLTMTREDPQFWKRYRDSHEIFRRRTLEALIAGRTGTEITTEAKERLRAEVTQVAMRIERNRISPLPDIGELAARADQLEANRLGEDYWTSDQDDLVTGFVQGPRMDGLHEIVVTTAGVVLSALAVVEQLFDDVKIPGSARGDRALPDSSG